MPRYRMAALTTLVASLGGALRAQTAPAPTAFTADVVNSMMGQPSTMRVFRDGSKAMIDLSTPPPTGGGYGAHLRSYYLLDTHKTYSRDLNNTSQNCSGGSFSGSDWGDPFEMTAGMMADINKQSPKQTGTETVNGFETRVLEAGAGDGKIKIWLDTKYGMLVKGDAGGRTLLEVKHLTVGKPQAALLAVPAYCDAPAGPSPDDLRISKITGLKPEEFLNALFTPGTPDACTILLRVVRAGSMQPIASGFQFALDRTPDPNGNQNYPTPRLPNGRTTFSGGAIREITGEFRNGSVLIADATPQFYVSFDFGNVRGSGMANINRHCLTPLTVLLMVVRNPEKIGEGVDWLWIKSGKYAAAGN